MMLIGSMVAECASTGIEWIYDPRVLEQKVASTQGSSRSLAFTDPPECPFFSYPIGHQGINHEQVEPFRRCLVHEGCVSEERQAAAFVDYYESCVNMVRHASNINTKYIDKLTKTFITNYREGKKWQECGINQHESQSLTKVPTLVARYSNDANTLLREVRKMVRIWQKDEGCEVSTKFCTLCARMLEYVLRKRCAPGAVFEHLSRLVEGKVVDEFTEPLGVDEMKIVESIQNLDVILSKINDIKSVLDLNNDATDAQKSKVRVIMSRALMTNGVGDEKHFRDVIASVAMEPVDKDVWNQSKAIAKDMKWMPSPMEKIGHAAVARLLGISCDVHGVFFIVCYLLQKCSSFHEAVILNMTLGGDCSARSVLLGAFYAASAYPLPESKQLLQYCAHEEASRPFLGDGDEISSLRESSSWIPIDWLCKTDSAALEALLSDSRLLKVCRSNVLLIKGKHCRMSTILKSTLAEQSTRPKVVEVLHSDANKIGDHMNASTLAILLLTDESAPDPTEVMLNSIQKIEKLASSGMSSQVVFLSSTCAEVPSTMLGKYYSVVENYLENSHLTTTIVRTPWMLENVFDAADAVKKGSLPVLFSPSLQFNAVSMRDISKAFSKMFADSNLLVNEKRWTLSGPQVSFDEVAQALSSAVGRDVRCRKVDSEEEFAVSWNLTNKSDVFAKGDVELYRQIEANSQKAAASGGSGRFGLNISEFWGVFAVESHMNDLLELLQWDNSRDSSEQLDKVQLSSLEVAMKTITLTDSEAECDEGMYLFD